MAKKKLFLLYFVIFSLFIPAFSFASMQDSLLSVEGIEFSESADTAAISDVPSDLVFSESPDTISQDTVKNSKNLAVKATPEVKNHYGGFFWRA